MIRTAFRCFWKSSRVDAFAFEAQWHARAHPMDRNRCFAMLTRTRKKNTIIINTLRRRDQLLHYKTAVKMQSTFENIGKHRVWKPSTPKSMENILVSEIWPWFAYVYKWGAARWSFLMLYIKITLFSCLRRKKTHAEKEGRRILSNPVRSNAFQSKSIQWNPFQSTPFHFNPSNQSNHIISNHIKSSQIKWTNQSNEMKSNHITSNKINWTNQIKSWINEWLSAWMNEWMNEWTNEWMNEWMNQWMNEWMK